MLIIYAFLYRWSEVIIPEQAEEADEESVAPMSIDKPQLHKEFSFHEAELTVEVVPGKRRS